MRILVTGGAGFIGATLCRALGAHPAVDDVVVLDDLSTGDAARLAGTGAHLLVGDIRDSACVRRAAAGAQVVVHLAARVSVPACLADPDGTESINAEGTRCVLAAARAAGAGRIVLASSAAVYGPDAPCPAPEDATPRPQEPYGRSKLRCERDAHRAAPHFPGGVLTLRLFNVFGPLQEVRPDHAPVVPAFFAAALAGRPVPMAGTGRQSRDFVYVGDVSAVMARAALARRVPAAPLNLGTGQETPLHRLADLVGSSLGRPVARAPLPARPGDTGRSRADVRHLHRAFPAPTPTSLAHGLARTAAWHRGGT